MLSRRSLILGAAGVIASAAAGAQGSVRVTLDEFVELSERLLSSRRVDRETAQLFLTALMTDRDTAVTLAYVIQSNGNPTPEQKVLSATIVEWWRTGVYQINGEPRLAARSRALWSPYQIAVESDLRS